MLVQSDEPLVWLGRMVELQPTSRNPGVPSLRRYMNAFARLNRQACQVLASEMSSAIGSPNVKIPC